MSLERILAIYNQMENNDETALFAPIIEQIESLTDSICSKENLREYRIISDHMKAITLILVDHKKINPSYTWQGYILRRLIRRVIRLIKMMGVSENILPQIAAVIISFTAHVYPELSDNQDFIYEQLEKESTMFSKTHQKKSGSGAGLIQGRVGRSLPANCSATYRNPSFEWCIA